MQIHRISFSRVSACSVFNFLFSVDCARPARVKGLTDIAARNARARDRAYKLSDGRGLCLLVQPNGSKWWRFRYDWDGKEQMLSMGTYPDTSLADARKRRDEARQKIEAGTDPGAQRRLTEGAPERTFQAVAQHYLAGLERKALSKKRSPHTLRKARWALPDYVFPFLGSKPIDSIRLRPPVTSFVRRPVTKLREAMRGHATPKRVLEHQ